MRAELDVEGEAVGVELLLREPPIRDAGGAGEPAASFDAVADQHRRRTVSLDQPDGDCGFASIKCISQGPDGREVEPPVIPCHEPKKIRRYQQISGVAVSCPTR